MNMATRMGRVLMLAAIVSTLAAARLSAQPDAAQSQAGGQSQATEPGAAQTDAPYGTAPEQSPEQSSTVIRETELDRQVKEVSSELRCVVCQGLSIQDSPSTLAQEMRSVVREQLAAGRTPEQVKAYFVERYGEWVLLRPKASGVNLIVYLLPIAMILGGAAFVFTKARSWTRAAREGAA